MTPGGYGLIVREIIGDLLTFAIAHATGRDTAARNALDDARMRLDELHGRVNPPKRGR